MTDCDWLSYHFDSSRKQFFTAFFPSFTWNGKMRRKRKVRFIFFFFLLQKRWILMTYYLVPYMAGWLDDNIIIIYGDGSISCLCGDKWDKRTIIIIISGFRNSILTIIEAICFLFWMFKYANVIPKPISFSDERKNNIYIYLQNSNFYTYCYRFMAPKCLFYSIFFLHLFKQRMCLQMASEYKQQL